MEPARAHPVRFVTRRGRGLCGSLYECGSESIVVMAHGLASDKTSRARFPKLAASLNSAGIDALAFDFAGCGESEDDVVTLPGLDDDLRSAVRIVSEIGYSKVALYGHSLGGLVALRAWSTDVATVAATGAVTDAMQYDWAALYGQDRVDLLAHQGFLTLGDAGQRQVRVARALLEAFSSVDQAALLDRIERPVLLVHGGDPNDREEQELLARSRQGMSHLPVGSKLEVIEGAGHSMIEQWDTVCQVVTSWMGPYLR
jgi:pimeloyl-ACP methyl ester carboxylesterase